MEYRIEHDSMSQVKVPADKLWAAQTQRSQQNFEIDVGTKTMPAEIIHAFGVLKKAAAITNNALRPEKMTNEKLEAICSFNKNCAEGIKANKEKMHHNLHNSLMLVTVLNPYIVYENAAKTVKLAFKNNISLKEACVELGFLTPEKFDEVFHPEEMV